MKMNKPTIALGMSGGVDSSVCAYLLKKAGYDVIGVFMQNWDSVVNNDILGRIKNEDKQCNVYKDFSDVQAVGKMLDIKVYKIDFIKQYWDQVFKYTIKEYKSGVTPNPDVLCNKYIKFNAFIKYVKDKFDCDQIAMGHYAKIDTIDGKKCLMLSKDDNKDQTYFLCWLTQKQLDKTIFPLADLSKNEVRKIAKKLKLINADKKESTGICFIGERKFQDFLKNYIKPKSGKIIDIVSKKIIGTHDGIMYYTIGQNKNLNLGGNASKFFVCKKDPIKNILYVVNENAKEKYLMSTSCVLSNFNWINTTPPKNNKVLIRFRHRQTFVKGIFSIVKKTVVLKYEKSLSVTPGQFAVLYQNNICLGGGIVQTIK
ncbi:MAG: tRNA 2-thiouridine(34) synthase MnmA [Mycoplasmoidaceae bacterium]|nr:MAG: tRNA 2-thiouridine(34) synthase MnmA [Mycoplasmoidaceae bacterium]